MSNSKNIEIKLQKFIQKFYLNELIKGILVFFILGLLYFMFTLFIEYFLWLKPLFRTILFWLFILVELVLLVFYIGFPIFKITGIKKGISDIEASEIIGKHFPEVKDKLLNMIQLKNSLQNSELIEASIIQKTKLLLPIPFTSAVDFSKNKKYIKYALIPIVIWLFTYVTGNIVFFENSLTRVVHYKTKFEPPAPFYFKVLNTSLNVVEGQSFTLMISAEGTTIPEEAKIIFGNENYYLENNGLGKFEYVFSNVKKTFSFSIEANDVISKNYTINVITTPVIINLKMVLKYPNYTQKSNEVIQNTGNAIVPQGTTIFWQVETQQTQNITFNSLDEKAIQFTQNGPDYFSYSKKVVESLKYIISSSNQQLTNFEKLNFTVQVIKDEYPTIYVKSDIDSISHGSVQFIGQLNDDYGIDKLQLVYTKNKENERKTHLIAISKSSFTDFYYMFPEGISLEKGIEYEMYFEVFDNDAVNGSKKTKSQVFKYYNKTDAELEEELLNEQNETIRNISKTLEKSEQSNLELENFKNELQKKATFNWNDTKKLEQFLKQQNTYKEMFQKQTDNLQKNLIEQPTTEALMEKKEELQKRIEEIKKLAEQEEILKELEDLTNKLHKEDFIEKLKELTKKNQQNKQSLERILELTKRFYVEQKANQISETLKKLSNKEQILSKEKQEANTLKKQEEINKEFIDIKKDLQELAKKNKELKRPMKLPDDKDTLNEIEDALEKALEELNKQEINKAKSNQKSAAKKMEKLSKYLEQSMSAMEGEQIDENIDDLRKIVENLIEFSFQQEDLLNKFSTINNNHPEYSENLKRQHVLKEYFEHIDDSLYVLSLRLVKMGSFIQKEVADVHYYIDESLVNFSDNRVEQGISKEHFTITSTNNLANQLSNLLERLMNASPSFGKGNFQEFSLPDIIKKQGELTNKMKDGIKKGEKPSNKKGENKTGNSEQINSELYEIYKQQEQLRQALEALMEGENRKKGFRDVVKKMEDLEKELIEEGFNYEIIEKMELLNHELLKLEKATLEKGQENKRKSNTNKQSFEKRNIRKFKIQKQYFNYNEILNRQSLPLRSIYKKKVQEYFKNEQ